uniref:EGF-like domain-containing protein n=1 Tax=Arcella intermedia TaxID=1963864 RepID=A0A6B2LAH3_9EUKA
MVYSSSCSDDYSFQETWTLTDKSDNSNIKTVDISVQVTTSLSWSTVPENLEIRCDDDFSLNSTGFANAIDQCSKVVPVTWNDSSTLRCLSQSYYIIRTFSAERCGISISHQQVFTVLPPIEPISPSPEPTCSCVYGVCTTGTECVACIPGYYGSVCSSPCTCQNGICNDGLNGDGLCFSCHDGYYGRDCDMVCTCQNGTCDASTGLCLYCQPGYYGLNCKSKCNCANCEDGIHGTGNCLNSPSSNNNNNNPGASQTENTKAYLGGIIAVLVVVSVLIALLLVGVICFFQFKQRKLIVVKELLKQQERDDSVPLV